MQLHIAVSDALINEVLASNEFKSTEEAIEQALQLLLKMKRQEKTKAIYSTAGFSDECRQQSLQLKSDPHEQEILSWLDAVADCEGWI